VLFDLGETLVHLDRPWDEIHDEEVTRLHRLLVERGLTADRERFVKRFESILAVHSAMSDLQQIEIPMRDTIAETLEKLGFRKVDDRMLEDLIREYYEPQVNSWLIFPDTRPTLQALQDRHVPIGLVSNTRSDYCARSILHRHGLTEFFDGITTSASVRIRKPRPQIFLDALSKLKVAATETAFVGDSLEADVAGARALNMKSIHVSRGPVADDSDDMDPDATVRSLNEALQHIMNWMSDG